VQRELNAKEKVRLAPQNQSPWDYIRGLSVKAKGGAAVLLESPKQFASEFASIDEPETIRSGHALDLLADIYAEEGRKEEASKVSSCWRASMIQFGPTTGIGVSLS
jgi:protein farnesyltransferase/geranylgeranyltransferase type-1 subunit alpha